LGITLAGAAYLGAVDAESARLRSGANSAYFYLVIPAKAGIQQRRIRKSPNKRMSFPFESP
jgi:hypothetical protein